ncbi:MAG: hypothetical protein LDL19_08275 [Thiobacillus sp.]|nr:hypothetical protein [Thiobacillus sp.]
MLPLAGCGVAQPVAETAARTVAMPLPGSFERLQAHQDCRAHMAEAHAQADDAARMAALDDEIESYRTMVEAALMYRAETLQLLAQIRATLDRGETLSGQDLAQLSAGLAEHLALRRQLFAVAEAHECWLGAWGPGKALASEARLKGVMLSLSAALMLYDNYLLAISLYQEEPRLRMLLNNKDVGYDIDYGELNRIALSFASEETRSRVRQGIAYYEAEIVQARATLAADRHLVYLDQLITQSPSYNMTRHFSPLAALGRKLGFYVPFTAETLLRLKDEGVNLTSMIFGNTVGLVESRRGKLYDRPDVRDGLANDLRAGDILVERTPFRLTDSFIPGRWGHAALWVGTESELRALGLWDDPVVRPYQAAIRAGQSVVEALRSGVQLNSLAHFLNVDDVAVLRPAGQTPAQQAASLRQALRQVGKRYDFNFDVETRDRLSCAELVYHAYGQIDWPTRRQLGRAVITPDDIAARALGEEALAVVALYNDGERVPGDLRIALERLMQ